MQDVCDFIDTMFVAPPPHPYPPPGYFPDSTVHPGICEASLPAEHILSKDSNSESRTCSADAAEAVKADEAHENNQQLVYVGRRNILVHCEKGISRSGTMIIAYLMRKQRLPLEQVLTDVRTKRSKIKPSANFMDQLEIWAQTEYNPWEDEEKTIPKPAYAAYLERRAALLKKKGLTGIEPMRGFE